MGKLGNYMNFFIAIVLQKFSITNEDSWGKKKQRQLEWKTRFKEYFISVGVKFQAITNIYNT